jgi:hypothetical protein
MSKLSVPAPNAKNRVRRKPQRASYDLEAIDAILDAGWVVHVGFCIEGQPFVIPTTYVRIGRELFLHGAAASRMLRSAGTAIPLCLTVTLLDGLVFARSAMHHSMNYRSVVIFGQAELVSAFDEKRRILEALVDRFSPQRSKHTRSPSEKELAATSVLRVAIVEASAKVRTGGPLEDGADLALPYWSGVIPLALRAKAPEPAADNPAGVPHPSLDVVYAL